MATLRQCVILAGRFGTSAIPLLADCAGRPALAWVLREFQRFGVQEFLLLTDDASGAVEQAAQAVAAGLPRAAQVSVVPVPAGSGSGGALLSARDRLDVRFLLHRGTMLFDCNIAELLAPGVEGAVMLHAPGHPPELGVFERGALQAFHKGDDLAAGALRVIPTQGWFADPRDPAQLAAAPRRLRRPALLLDRDGVLNVDHGWVGTRERFEWMPGALDAIRCATQGGWHVFVVTNQSGVARGFYDEDAVHALLGWMAEQAHAAGGTIDDTRYCPYHEDAAVERYRRAHHWRKPQPGMLLDLIRAWELDPARCLMIGDQQSDMQAAATAGVQGHLFPGGNLLAFAQPLIAGFPDRR